MRFLFDVYDKKMTEILAILNKMTYTVGPQISENTNKKIEDFNAIYKSFKNKCVYGENGGIYNGNVNSDIFSGPNGTKLKGLHSIKTFGLSIIDEIKDQTAKKA